MKREVVKVTGGFAGLTGERERKGDRQSGVIGRGGLASRMQDKNSSALYPPPHHHPHNHQTDPCVSRTVWGQEK